MNTELVTQKQLQEVVVSGQEVLQNSSLRVNKAITVGEQIVKAIKEQGMSAELDERCNKYLVNCRAAKTEIENQRKPITAFFDLIRKQFTENESKLDVKKADSIPATLQTYRDLYVKKLREEELEKQKKAQLKVDTENEAIEIKISIEKQFSEYIQNHIAERKQKLFNSFNAITIDNYLIKSDGLKKLTITYDKAHYDSFSPVFFNKIHSKEECISILEEFLSSKEFDLISAVVVSEINKAKKELIEKLPSLKNELEEMAKASNEEAKKLAETKAKRVAKEEERLKIESEEKKKEEEQQLELQKVSAQTNALMDGLSIIESAAPETRDGLKIQILNKGGISEIFSFWLQREGMTLSIEEIEKKSITQMKAYCEKIAHKSGDMIVSENIKYEPVYKAVNRK